jgi:hypothetical protein
MPTSEVISRCDSRLDLSDLSAASCSSSSDSLDFSLFVVDLGSIL